MSITKLPVNSAKNSKIVMNKDIERIIFNVFKDSDKEIYEKILGVK